MIECPNCGYQCNDGAKFCLNCGCTLSEGNSNFYHQEIQKATKNSNHTFIDPDEAVQATIGVSYAQSFMSGVRFKKGAAILTDKRLYYFGKNFSNFGRGMNTTTEEGIISVDEITFTRFIHGSPTGFLIMGIVSILPGVVSLRSSFGLTNSAAGVFGMMGFILTLLGILSLTAYFWGRSTVMEISFPGGKYCFDSRWHSSLSMQEFQRQIHLVKDRLNGNESTNTSEKMEEPQ